MKIMLTSYKYNKILLEKRYPNAINWPMLPTKKVVQLKLTVIINYKYNYKLPNYIAKILFCSSK